MDWDRSRRYTQQLYLAIIDPAQSDKKRPKKMDWEILTTMIAALFVVLLFLSGQI